jgi:hypothetical protein
VYLVSLPNPGHEGKPKFLRSDNPTLIERWIKAENRPGFGIYYLPNPLKPGATTHSKENIAAIVAVYVDVDFKDITETADETVRRLGDLPLQPTLLVSSGHGCHVLWQLKEAIACDDPEFESVCALQAALIDYLGADPQVRPWSLLRQPGTLNSKRDPHVPCEIIRRGPIVDISEVRDMAELVDGLHLLTHKPRPAAAGPDTDTDPDAGERKPPVDVEARLAAMKFGGPGETSIHATQLSVTASLLRSGVALEEAARIVLDATRAAVADDPKWNWRREELGILRMGCDFIVKKPELVTLLPDAWREPFAAALTQGRRPDIGFNRSGFYLRAWKTKAGESTEKPADAPAADTPASDTPTGWSLYDSARVEPPRWLIKGLLPETGMAIIPGQWGSYKTTTALDMALAVMTDRPFAGQYRIKRAGAVIYFALEGAGTLQSRLAAIARQHSAPDKLPFAWRGDCPLLTAKDAGPAIATHCDAAARYFKRVYGVPTVLILIDTYSVAAGFTLSGDDSDVSATQKTFNALRYVHKHTGAAVVVVDHFGKMMDSGTRGSSNKEGNADAVLATLADKELNGTISNTRLAVRKQRDGRSGFEIPFTPQVVELGLDEDGDPITAVVLDWGNPRMAAHPPRKSKDLALLCTVLAGVTAKKGFPFLPEPGGPAVQACHSDDLRDAFLAQRKKRRNAAPDGSAPRMAYARALAAAVEHGLAGTRSNAGQNLVWKKG